MLPTSHRGQAVQRVSNRHHAAKISSHHGALAQEWRPGDPAVRPLGPTPSGFGPFGRTPAGTPGGASAKRCPPTSGHDDQRRPHLDRHSVYAIGLGDNRKPTLCTAAAAVAAVAAVVAAVAAPILLMVRARRVRTWPQLALCDHFFVTTNFYNFYFNTAPDLPMRWQGRQRYFLLVLLPQPQPKSSRNLLLRM